MIYGLRLQSGTGARVSTVAAEVLAAFFFDVILPFLEVPVAEPSEKILRFVQI